MISVANDILSSLHEFVNVHVCKLINHIKFLHKVIGMTEAWRLHSSDEMTLVTIWCHTLFGIKNYVVFFKLYIMLTLFLYTDKPWLRQISRCLKLTILSRSAGFLFGCKSTISTCLQSFVLRFAWFLTVKSRADPSWLFFTAHARTRVFSTSGLLPICILHLQLCIIRPWPLTLSQFVNTDWSDQLMVDLSCLRCRSLT